MSINYILYMSISQAQIKSHKVALELRITSTGYGMYLALAQNIPRQYRKSKGVEAFRPISAHSALGRHF